MRRRTEAMIACTYANTRMHEYSNKQKCRDFSDLDIVWTCISVGKVIRFRCSMHFPARFNCRCPFFGGKRNLRVQGSAHEQGSHETEEGCPAKPLSADAVKPKGDTMAPDRRKKK